MQRQGQYQGFDNQSGHSGGTGPMQRQVQNQGSFPGRARSHVGSSSGQQQGMPFGSFNAGSGFNGYGSRPNPAVRPTGRFNHKGGTGRGRGRGYGRNFVGAAVVPPSNGNIIPPRSAPVDEQVSQTAAALIPVAQVVAAKLPSDQTDGVVENAKKQKKVDTKCYRCGFSGHVLADCEVPLCDCCESAEHESEECPLLDAPKPQVLIYGHYHDDLTFFGMDLIDSYRPKTENTRLAMVTVTGGIMSIPQIARHLQRVVPVDQYNWDILQVGQNVYKVMFPSKAELDRLTLFGGFRDPNSVCELKVDAWHVRVEPMWQLPHVWVQMEGIPERHTGDFLALWGLGTLFGKTTKVDMAYTRKHKVLRILIGCVDHTKIPKDLPLWIKDGFYQITFVVEPMLVEDERDMDVDDGHDNDNDSFRKNDDSTTEKKQEGKVVEPPVVKQSPNPPADILGTPNNSKQQTTGVVFSPLLLKSFERISKGNEEFVPSANNVSCILQYEKATLRNNAALATSTKATSGKVAMHVPDGVTKQEDVTHANPQPADGLALASQGDVFSSQGLGAVLLPRTSLPEQTESVLPLGDVAKLTSSVTNQVRPSLDGVSCDVAAAAVAHALHAEEQSLDGVSVQVVAVTATHAIPTATHMLPFEILVEAADGLPSQTCCTPVKEELVFSDKEVIAFGGIASPSSLGARSSARIRSQPLADVHAMDRAMLMAQRRDEDQSAGYSPGHILDSNVVFPSAVGAAGAYGV